MQVRRQWLVLRLRAPLLLELATNVKVVKHFDFDHHRMTQSVIVKKSDGSLVAFVKGSGESIKKLCLQEGFPSDYDFVVRASAKGGSYLISMHRRSFPRILM
jgi:magnesium-transporting ATPase (P-type)